MADIRSLEMPKWGMTMEEGTITGWNFSEGDSVSEGDAVAEAESSKLSGEIEAPVSGVLRKILAQEGDTVEVSAAVAVIADASVSDAEIDEYVASLGGDSAASAAPAEEPAPEAAKEEVAEKKEDVPEKEKPSKRTTDDKVKTDSGKDSIPESLKGSDDEEVAATPHAEKLAKKHGIALSKIEASGRGDRVTVADLQKAVKDAGGHLSFGNDRERKPFAAVRGDDSRVKATVHARKLAEEEGVNLLGVRASGREGTVTRDDVRAWIALNREPEAVPATSEAQAEKGGSGSASSSENSGKKIPMSTMRKVIASRLQESYQEAPHFRVTAEAKIDKLLAFRKEVNNNRLDIRLTVNDLVTAAVSKALKAVPEVNAQYDPDSQTITQFEHADISIAVSTGEGLITPIVKAADTLSPSQISEKVHDLATRAKAGTLKPEEFQGGTFTISNLGMFGISNFDAIINPPQVAILAVGGAKKQFVPDAEGNPVAATVLTFTLSADHRVVDGAVSAKFCSELKSLLETPALIFA